MEVAHWWRDYRTFAGRSPVKEFLQTLKDIEAVAVAGAMKDVEKNGLRVARHLQGEIYEVRAQAEGTHLRLLFAEEGAKGRVFLALEGFKKKSQRTPKRKIDLAKKRLMDWRARASPNPMHKN